MDFKQVQQSFIDYIRDPQQPVPAGVPLARMQVYRELVFNNLMGFVSNGFPVLKSLYTDEQWQSLVQAFLSQHDCKSPIFIDIAGEFLDFLQFQYVPAATDPPFMLELAHYEWLELRVATAQQDSRQVAIAKEAISHSKLCLAATASVAQYQYPVQQIRPDYRPAAPLANPVFFCLYQDEVGEVGFLQLTPLSAQVLGYLMEQGQGAFAQLTQWLVSRYPQMPTETLIQGCLALLEQLAAKGIVKGVVEGIVKEI